MSVILEGKHLLKTYDKHTILNNLIYIVCLQAVNLPKQYKSGTLQAYRLLCTSHVCRHDIALSDDQLARFYTVLHQGLVSQDQVCISHKICSAYDECVI